MKLTSVAFCSIVLLATSNDSSAQSQPAPSSPAATPAGLKVQPAQRVAGYLDLGSHPRPGGATVPDGAKSTLTTVYANTSVNGWFSTSSPATGSIWHDWGIMTAADNSATATHHTVTHLALGYVSSLSTGGTTALLFYAFDQSTGFCSAGGLGTLQFSVYVYGLPGTYPTWANTGWTFTVPLENLFGTGVSGTWEQLEGPIGYGYDFIDNLNTGVMTVGRPNPTGDQDSFDFYDSTGTTCTGTYWFGGYGATNPFASFYLGMTGWQSWEVPFTQPRVGGGVCVSSCGGRWNLAGEGPTADGDWLILNLSTSAAFANPTQHQSALIAGAGQALGTFTFGSGCVFYVPPPITLVLLGNPTQMNLPAQLPVGLGPPAQFTFQVVIKDNGDSGCGGGGSKVVATNPVHMFPF